MPYASHYLVTQTYYLLQKKPGSSKDVYAGETFVDCINERIFPTILNKRYVIAFGQITETVSVFSECVLDTLREVMLRNR